MIQCPHCGYTEPLTCPKCGAPVTIDKVTMDIGTKVIGHFWRWCCVHHNEYGPNRYSYEDAVKSTQE